MDKNDISVLDSHTSQRHLLRLHIPQPNPRHKEISTDKQTYPRNDTYDTLLHRQARDTQDQDKKSVKIARTVIREFDHRHSCRQSSVAQSTDDKLVC